MSEYIEILREEDMMTIKGKVMKVVNLRSSGYDVYIGRGSIFGNPYKSGSRNENCDNYEIYFHERIKNDPFFKEQVLSLQGKILGCYCKPKRCHGDTIIEYLERR